MTRDNDKQPEDSDDDLNEFARDPFKRSGQQQADPRDVQDRLREDFEDDFDDDPYDEPERDTAYPPAYREEDDEDDEEYYDDPPLTRASGGMRDGAGEHEPDDYIDDDDEDDDEDDLEEPRERAGRAPAPGIPAADSRQWVDEPDYDDDGDELEPGYNQRLPVALLVVAAVAVILLLAGGYGVMQDRAASKDEIVQLKAALATAASGEQLDEARAEAEALRAQNNELEDQLYDLQIENRKLADLVAGLEAQVEAVNTDDASATPAPASAATTAPAPAPAAAPASAPAPATQEKPPQPASSGTTGDWFVNFGSYGERSAAQAWQSRLQPAAGDVITAAGEREGRTFYRVRVVNLPDKATAEKVARALEAEYGLSRLWVGQQ